MIMDRRNLRGASSLEFALIVLTLVPLLLGIGATGINLIRTLQTAQLARDAGHMFARGVDFSQPGNQTVLNNIGSNLGFSSAAGSGSAALIFSALTYVDQNTCAAAGAVDGNGNPSGCTNLGKWVFTQRLVMGNSGVRASNIGSPLTSGPNGVTVDSSTGKISTRDYATKSGAVAQFNSVNPYASVNGTNSGLPSGQYLYIAEAAATAFKMPPFVGVQATYSYGMF
jgi:hypothetical protein